MILRPPEHWIFNLKCFVFLLLKLFLIIIHHSNASEEEMFSFINKNKTPDATHPFFAGNRENSLVKPTALETLRETAR